MLTQSIQNSIVITKVQAENTHSLDLQRLDIHSLSSHFELVYATQLDNVKDDIKDIVVKYRQLYLIAPNQVGVIQKDYSANMDKVDETLSDCKHDLEEMLKFVMCKIQKKEE